MVDTTIADALIATTTDEYLKEQIYQEGVAARKSGESAKDNPYESSSLASDWWEAGLEGATTILSEFGDSVGEILCAGGECIGTAISGACS